MRKLSGLIGLSVLAMVAGCASDVDQTPSSNPGSDLSNENAVDRLEQDIAPLQGNCVLTAVTGSTTQKTAAINLVSTGEAIIVAKRPVDGMFVVNGNLCTVSIGGATSATLAANVTAVTITGSANADVVILDFTAGVFATKAATGTNGIAVNLDAGTDTLAIKGTNLADNVTYGQATVAANGAGYISFNAATVVTKLHDVEFSGVEKHLASLGAGNDTYTLAPFNTGSTETMSVFGGAGDDTFNEGALSTPNETINGGDGLDTVSYASRAAAVAYNYVAGAAANDGEATIDVDNVVTSSEKDNIMGDVETVMGGAGNDLLVAPAAAIAIDSKTNITHRLIGGAGDDQLFGGLGPDYLDGGAGNDILYDNVTQADGKDVANGADTYIGGEGTDTMDYSLRVGAISVTMSGAAVSGATGELDKVDLTVENLIGGAGADTLIGNANDNIIDGGAANDSISGLAGTDTVDYSNRTHAVAVDLRTTNVLSGDSTDIVDSKGDSVNIADIENVIGSATAANTIYGNANDNEITGGAGIDTIDTGAGNDIVDMGGAGVDNITCGGDMDMIVNASAAEGVTIDVSCDIVF